jgi:hypothetical protein
VIEWFNTQHANCAPEFTRKRKEESKNEVIGLDALVGNTLASQYRRARLKEDLYRATDLLQYADVVRVL